MNGVWGVRSHVDNNIQLKLIDSESTKSNYIICEWRMESTFCFSFIFIDDEDCSCCDERYISCVLNWSEAISIYYMLLKNCTALRCLLRNFNWIRRFFVDSTFRTHSTQLNIIYISKTVLLGRYHFMCVICLCEYYFGE